MARIGFNPKGGRIKTDARITIDRAFVAHYEVAAAAAVAASANGVLAATALDDDPQEITTGITHPAVPRNLSVSGNAAGIAGNVVITGTNQAGEAISETIALNGAATVQGNKAFRSVTKVELPAKTNSEGDTVSVGWGNKLGVPYKLPHNTVLAAYLNNAKESTSPTVATSATALEANTVTLASALNGTKVDIYLLV